MSNIGPVPIVCVKCGTIVYIKKCRALKGKARYCSRKCKGMDQRNALDSLHGYGEKSSRWMGSKVKYNGIHEWIKMNNGKASRCDFDNDHVGARFEWANISGSYSREIDDWAQLCSKCHRHYDRIRAGKMSHIRIDYMEFISA